MNQQFYTRQDLFFMQIWVGLGYRWVFVLRFTTQWVGLGWRFTTHNPHGLGLGSRLSTHRWVLARTRCSTPWSPSSIPRGAIGPGGDSDPDAGALTGRPRVPARHGRGGWHPGHIPQGQQWSGASRYLGRTGWLAGGSPHWTGGPGPDRC
jgi:hypothetical protein